MKKLLVAIYVMSMGTLLSVSSLAWFGTPPPLGSAQCFTVLGASTVTNTGPTVVTGSVGVSPGTAVTGFPPGKVIGGTIHAADATAAMAQADAHAAYTNLAGQACGVNLTGKILGSTAGAVTLTPGIYCFSSSAQLTGTLTLNGNGVFIFKIGSTLTTASNASVVLTNGATAANVFWQVGSSATLGTNTVFVGSIFAMISDTITTGASVTGRVFALTGAVTMDSNAITNATPCTGTGGGGGGQQCNDFTSGHGSFTGPSGSKAKFEFEAGFKSGDDKNGSPHGELTYSDDGFECVLKMKSTDLTAYLDKGPNSRRIQGTGEINGHEVTYQLDVSDNESGTDTFAIRLSNGYSASGHLKTGQIEIDNRCPKN